MASSGTTSTGTPQGGILSPLLANIALSVLDEHFAEALGGDGELASARSVAATGWPTTGSSGTRTISWSWWPAPGLTPKACTTEVAAVLAPMGLRLSEEKTMIAHIDEGFDFLGLRIQRHQKRGGTKRFVYTYPSKKALGLRHRQGADDHPAGQRTSRSPSSCSRLNPVLRGWTNVLPARGVKRRPSPTCAPSPGGGSSAGSAASTPRPHGSRSDGATSLTGGGRRKARIRLFNPAR